MSCHHCASPSYNSLPNWSILLSRVYSPSFSISSSHFSSRNREDCTRLLTLLVSATQRLIKPYALPILRVLIPKANDSNPAVAANVLMCLGELAAVGGEDVAPHIPELMQVIISRLQDPAHVKRDAALRTLGQLCSSTGYVISPLVDYPQLLPILGRILRTESGSSRREVVREVVKVLGILGALDPYRRKVSRIALHRYLALKSGVRQSRTKMELLRGPSQLLLQLPSPARAP